jgi:prolyl-tRNA synthetase
MSTRMIGAIIMAHGDDQGLVLPPRLAPYQAVIVPVGRGEAMVEVTAAVDALAARCTAAGLRVRVDDRPQLSPGFKFNDWEMRGVPVRIELGPRDLAAGVAVVARRIGGDKQTLPLDGLAEALPGILEEIQAAMLARATQFRDDNTATVEEWEAFVAAVSTGWAGAFHCGEPACEDDIKATTAATPRCVPIEAPSETGLCVRCGNPSAYGKRVLFGRSY